MASRKEDDNPESCGDKELDDLLDSALEDLKPKSKKVVTTDEHINNDEDVNDADEIPELGDQWSDEFIKQATAQFETNMAQLLKQIPGNEEADFSTSMQKMAGEFHAITTKVLSSPAETTSFENDSVTATISETLRKLTEGTQSAQNAFSEDNLVNMFSNMGLNESNDSENGFLPFMQGMMQSLLSKDVLYPSLKETADKFPSWLEDNKEKLDASDYKRYQNQSEIMTAVCHELQQETEIDCADLKSQRFNKVLELMQKLQDLGHPPKELVGELPPGVQLDSQGLPMLPTNIPGMPADPNQCNMM